jgi:dTDP-glucose pyrophosphorylase
MLCKDGSTYEPKQEDIIAWERAYSKRGVDVRQELLSMESWLDANPKKRKVDMKRFIDNWLKRAAQAGGSPMAKSRKQSSRNIPIEHKLCDIGWVQNVETKQDAKQFYLNKLGYYFDGELKNGKDEVVTI